MRKIHLIPLMFLFLLGWIMPLQVSSPQTKTVFVSGGTETVVTPAPASDWTDPEGG